MSGITKIFVGELVETAQKVMVEWGDTGKTQAKHIREAHRRLKRDGKVPIHFFSVNYFAPIMLPT